MDVVDAAGQRAILNSPGHRHKSIFDLLAALVAGIPISARKCSKILHFPVIGWFARARENCRTGKPLDLGDLIPGGRRFFRVHE
jgi:hypothetical protein